MRDSQTEKTDTKQEDFLLNYLTSSSIVVEETAGDVSPDTLWGSEITQAARYSRSRLAEYATARSCARQALVRVGVKPCVIPTGKRREPIWPSGVVGSITHCKGHRAAAVALQSELFGLGIDAEVNATVGDGVRRMIMCEQEADALDCLQNDYPMIAWDRVLFSAKESVYKLWNPLMEEWLDFLECKLRLQPPCRIQTANNTVYVQGTFLAHLVKPLIAGDIQWTSLRGQWIVRGGEPALPKQKLIEGHIGTCIALQREESTADRPFSL